MSMNKERLEISSVVLQARLLHFMKKSNLFVWSAQSPFSPASLSSSQCFIQLLHGPQVGQLHPDDSGFQIVDPLYGVFSTFFTLS